MHLISTLSLAALVALAAALPQADTPDSTIVDIGPIPPAPPGLEDGASIVETGNPDDEPADKRSANLERRSFRVQIWSDVRRGGRHQSLVTDGERYLDEYEYVDLSTDGV